jgi:hypothetical protein
MTGGPVVIIGDDDDIDRRGPAVTFGPRPPLSPPLVPDVGAHPRPPWSPAVGRAFAVGAALLVGLVAGWVSISPAPADPHPPGRRPAPVARPGWCPGCGPGVSWFPDRGEVVVGQGPTRARYALGRPGDRLLVGDWACDGREAAALYRPSTGEVLRFDRWATPEDPTPTAERQATGIVDGTARIVRDGACDEVVVLPRSP